MNTAEYICEILAQYGVNYIFGYPGAAILPLMQAIQQHPQLEWVLMRNESSAIFAAAAQAKLTQCMSVCMATSGPGASNLVTGLLDANLDRAPVLVITGLIPTFKHGLGFFQDINQVSLLNACCDFSLLCENAAQLTRLLQNAIGYIIKQRKPAHLAIAMDTQVEIFSTPPSFPIMHKNVQLMSPPSAALDIVAEELALPDTVIAVGPRSRLAGKAIEYLAEKLQAPIICSFAGKGIIREDHPNYFGVLGLFGAPSNKTALCLIEKAQTVLALGIDDLTYFLTNKHIEQCRAFIQCEPDITCLSFEFAQKRVLLGELNATVTLLAERVRPASQELLCFAGEERQRHLALDNQKISSCAKGTIHQKKFFEKLNYYINHEKLILCFDIGDCVVWATQYLKLTQYSASLVSNRLGSMGFCLPALIAAKLEKPHHTVIGICGDGGMQMVLGEFNTLVQMNLNVYLIVFNNGILQRVVAQQQKAYGTDLHNPDYVKFAESCGGTGISITQPEDIEAKLQQAFGVKQGPVLIEVKCDPRVFAPMASWND